MLLSSISDPPELELGLCDVGDADSTHLQGLRNLRSLALTGEHVKGDGLKYLKGLRQLRELNITRTGIGDEGLRTSPVAPPSKRCTCRKA